MWASIAKKNKDSVKKPHPDLKISRNNKAVPKKQVIVVDYWNDEKFEANWNPVEKQIAQSYRRNNFAVPKEIYGRPGLLDKYKN
tara:strand:+ start:131 stop:382 length:252 start_codon:yes stop_codon:yes gene_type:complete